ncbi:multidrug efflux SMR transporter [Nocardioides zeae]|uniref:Multidrug efflux SMR transporter n=1 Tax=Nocardioides imazamoxiresistens TaxID=3231893 RepID=A0ABU3Q2C6_9ACTN|nr:multidrug efflux SMR transporter [Nocardioides zeae]MDT9595200.1 multidrug efflux SMR transporter [Nocardioides zeae]
MAWLVLLLSSVLEAVWATALGRSEGFTNLGPSVVFAVGLVASMVTLAHAARQIPIGVAYAVWAGLGAVLTAGWAITTGEETASVAKVLLLAGIVLCIVGLKLAEGGRKEPDVG